jgi:phage protein D
MTPTTTVFLSAATRAMRLHEYDSKTREIKTSDIISDDTATVNRASQGQVAATTDAIKGDLYPGNTADPEEKAKAQAQFKDDQSNMGVRVEVDSLGIPDLLPGQLVEVAGVAAKRIDGNYAVFEVTHSLGDGGFSTKFTGISNVGQFILLPGKDPSGEFAPAKSQNKNQKNEKAPQDASQSTYTVTPKVVV